MALISSASVLGFSKAWRFGVGTGGVGMTGVEIGGIGIVGRIGVGTGAGAGAGAVAESLDT